MHPSTALLLLLAAPAAVPARAAGAQSTPEPHVTFGVSAGVASAATYLSDGSGVRVRGGAAPYVGVVVERPLVRDGRPVARAGLFARGLRSAVKTTVGGTTYGSGSATEVVAGVALSRDVVPRLALRAGVGGAYVTGPDDAAPFRGGGGIRPSGELGATYPVAPSVLVEATAAAYRVGASDVVDNAGAVTRFGLGVRYAR